jgi:aminopeptidase-like protein
MIATHLGAVSGDEVSYQVDPLRAGEEMHRFMSELFPICRSITGEGARRTHDAIRRRMPIETHEVPTGTRVFDWTIPREWNVREAYLLGPVGQKIVDIRDNNLHVLNYSTPVRGRMSLRELRPHLYSLPERPEAIPYRTSYYEDNWGFCMTHRQLQSLEEGSYEVVIDTELRNGSLTYSEYVLPGEVEDEVLVSTYTCHPSLCNDNLSGVVLSTWLARLVSRIERRFTYRFLFLPETIGAITWLALNEQNVSRVQHGLVVTCVGDAGSFTYKKSRRGDAQIDRAAIVALRDAGVGHEVVDFMPSGSDERQYCSPGFDLPVGSLMRTPPGRFAEYHTSLDDPSFVQPWYLGDSLAVYAEVLYVLESDRAYLSRNPKTEPQLGRRGLYRAIGGSRSRDDAEEAIRWVLNLSDGHHSLLDIAERSKMSFRVLKRAADTLVEHDLLLPA